MTGARSAVEALTGVAARSINPMGATLWTAELDDGRSVIVKRGTDGLATAEAAGLRWLAVPDGPPIPVVHGHDEQWLVADHVPGGRMSADGAEQFGRRLAALHSAGAPAFGAPPPAGPSDAWIGTAPMRNEPASDWPSWYAEHRVLPYLRSAAASMQGSDVNAVEQVCDRIGELAGPPEPPSRLHGDLWSGNVHAGADGQVWLIDPAAHGGHRETDLAMLALFGAPQLERMLACYDEAAPLADGWRDRVPLHQLFPLLVHAVMFGGGYGASAGAAARTVLR